MSEHKREGTERHHWVPQFHLRRFAVQRDPAKKKGPFWAQTIRKQNNVLQPQRVDKICSKPKWNKVNIPGVGPNAFERQTSAFDDRASAVIRSIVETQQLPYNGSDSGDDLIEFVARLVIRNDQNRFRQISWLRLMLKQTKLDEALRSSDRWLSFLHYLALFGGGMYPGALDYEEARGLYEQGELEFHIEQTSIIGREMIAVDRLCASICRLPWFLRQVRRDAPDLITSDTPVQIWPGEREMPGFFGNTAILLPLSPRLLLFSPGGPFMRKGEVLEDEVLELNTRTYWGAEATVVSKSSKIWLLDSSGNKAMWQPEMHVSSRSRTGYHSIEMPGVSMRLGTQEEKPLFT